MPSRSLYRTLLAGVAAMSLLSACASFPGGPDRTAGAVEAAPQGDVKTTPSTDGVDIAYETFGEGPVAIVFIHGWSCDRSYWREQIVTFAEDYRVLTVDLAGHGASGSNREAWSIDAFGGDIASAVRAEGLDKVILVGHSMGGPAMLEAARRLGPRVAGMVGVDTLKRPGGGMPQDQAEAAWRRLTDDFETGTRRLVKNSFFPEGADPVLEEEVAADMAAASPDVAFNSGVAMYVYDMLDGLVSTADAPLALINSSALPTEIGDHRLIRRNARLVEYDIYGHFPMLEAPDWFNLTLAAEIERMLGAADV